jgi:hypothetical protein
MKELPIFYDPTVLKGRVASARHGVIWGAVTLGLTLVVLAGVLIHIQVNLDGTPGETWAMARWVLAFSAGFSVLTLVGRLVWFYRQRAGLRRVGEGLALRLSSGGVQTAADGPLPWDAIEEVRAARGKWGHGYSLELRGADGSTQTLPLEGLDLLPGSLDAATRAYSAGRHGVDLSVVDD